MGLPSILPAGAAQIKRERVNKQPKVLESSTQPIPHKRKASQLARKLCFVFFECKAAGCLQAPPRLSTLCSLCMPARLAWLGPA